MHGMQFKSQSYRLWEARSDLGDGHVDAQIPVIGEQLYEIWM